MTEHKRVKKVGATGIIVIYFVFSVFTVVNSISADSGYGRRVSVHADEPIGLAVLNA